MNDRLTMKMFGLKVGESIDLEKNLIKEVSFPEFSNTWGGYRELDRAVSLRGDLREWIKEWLTFKIVEFPYDKDYKPKPDDDDFGDIPDPNTGKVEITLIFGYGPPNNNFTGEEVAEKILDRIQRLIKLQTFK